MVQSALRTALSAGRKREMGAGDVERGRGSRRARRGRALATALMAMMVAMTEGGVRRLVLGESFACALEEEASFGVEHHGG